MSEQTATLRVLRTDPVDYLVTPRVLACVIAVPVLTALCFTVGMAASVLLAEGVYEVLFRFDVFSLFAGLVPPRLLVGQCLVEWQCAAMPIKGVTSVLVSKCTVPDTHTALVGVFIVGAFADRWARTSCWTLPSAP